MMGLRRRTRRPESGDISRWQVARAAFRAFRRTRPFVGGLMLMLSGAQIAYVSSAPVGLVLSGGWDSSVGYLLGGILIFFGIVVWASPMYAPLMGISGVLVSLLAFVSSNLGGYVIGTLLGVFGGALAFGWGEKRQRVPKSRRSRV